MRTTLITQTAIDDPVTIKEARQHLNQPENMEDSEIVFLVQAAKEQVEHKLGRKLVAQTWEGYLDQFPTDYIELPYAPVASITSITYRDSANALQTITASDYVLDTSGDLPRIALAYNKFWPTALGVVVNPIVIKFVVGYPTADAIPQSIKHYIKLLIGELRAHKEITTEREVFTHPQAERLLDPYRTY